MDLKCDICVKAFTGIENLQQHNASERHKKKVRLSQMGFSNMPVSQENDPPISVSQGNDPLKLVSSSSSAEFSTLSTESQVFRCTLCSTTLSGFFDYQKHVNSLEHAQMVQNNETGVAAKSNMCLEENNADKIVVGKYFNTSTAANASLNTSHAECKLCDKQFSGPEPYQQHLVSAGHKKKVAQNQWQESDKDENQCHTEIITGANTSIIASFAECKLCSKQFTGPEPYQQHLVSAGHKKKVVQNQWQGSDENENQCDTEMTTDATRQNLPECLPVVNSISPAMFSFAQCGVCDKRFTGPEPYQQHLASAAHKKKIDAQEDFKKNMMVNVVSSPDSTSSKDSDHEALSFMQDWYCKTCDKHCSGPMPYNQHIVSEAHRKKSRTAEILLDLRNNEAKLLNESDKLSNEINAFTKISNVDTLNQLSREPEMNDENLNLITFNSGDKTNKFNKGFNMSPNDLIFDDALKHFNVISPEDLNVVVFRPDEEIKFDYPVQIKHKGLKSIVVDGFEA